MSQEQCRPYQHLQKLAILALCVRDGRALKSKCWGRHAASACLTLFLPICKCQLLMESCTEHPLHKEPKCTTQPRLYLAMGKGPHHENNRITTGHQLSDVTDVFNRKGSANFHTANWEVVGHWILNYLKTKTRVSPRTGPRTYHRFLQLTFKSF